ncbi:MAG: hypothetical protein ACK4HQ_09685 [Brevinematales bacterium]
MLRIVIENGENNKKEILIDGKKAQEQLKNAAKETVEATKKVTSKASKALGSLLMKLGEKLEQK